MTTLLGQLAEQGVRPASISADSRRVAKGGLFLAYPGERVDGRKYIAQAVAQGAAAVLWERDGYQWDAAWQIPNLPVKGLREQAGMIADEFYGHPSLKLWIAGVTGTNGKTSCSHWLAQAMTRLGRKTACIGTIGNGFPGALAETINTTPDPITLHGMLADYLAQGAAGVAMEVSSHGLVQGRVSGMHFDVAVFTNLSREHLDYHGDMQAYGDAKRRLFSWPELHAAVVNVDDAYGRQLAAELSGDGVRTMTYGLQAGEVRGCNLRLSAAGLAMDVETPEGNARLESRVLGRFNAYNLLAVLATLLVSGVALQDAVRVLGETEPVAGRMQRLGGGQAPLVVIDYAHTPDALEKVLVALREQTAGQLLCVFGCGGNRDKGKRPLMGEISSRLADGVIVTSDNPRNEDPAAIIADIVAGMGGNYHVEADRAAAIDMAVSRAHAGDVVLIAGKGHEDYQDVAGVRLPFSDVEVARRALGAAA